ncbi:hypothetical protein IP92_00752 [Pseudoduganella flava]|uniref:DUF3761 domain-containing protein n=1 Tax=Pseudoduganella flava TaxID=871742 RepID=A0A562Q4W1_9BURK|nr:hypothetical protein [Pseudoduganella flava]QGZ41761.1 hypothetical protein GO485_23690 [Pseudoduganella flava]TWI51764.1 hypothetical protein IP92_00752 [Pseudoduganella flava]
MPFAAPRCPSFRRYLLCCALLALAGAHAQEVEQGRRNEAANPAAAAKPAADQAAYARLPVCKLAPDGRSLAVEPCRTAPAQRPMPRRPVPHQDYPEPRIGIQEAPRPELTLPAATLEPRSPYPAAPVPPVPPAVNPQAAQSPYVSPAPGTFAAPPPGPSRPSPAACVGGVCRDAGGAPYTGGGGTGVLKSPSGRICTSTGGFIRCM